MISYHQPKTRCFFPKVTLPLQSATYSQTIFYLCSHSRVQVLTSFNFVHIQGPRITINFITFILNYNLRWTQILCTTYCLDRRWFYPKPEFFCFVSIFQVNWGRKITKSNSRYHHSFILLHFICMWQYFVQCTYVQLHL